MKKLKIDNIVWHVDKSGLKTRYSAFVNPCECSVSIIVLEDIKKKKHMNYGVSAACQMDFDPVSNKGHGLTLDVRETEWVNELEEVSSAARRCVARIEHLARNPKMYKARTRQNPPEYVDDEDYSQQSEGASEEDDEGEEWKKA